MIFAILNFLYLEEKGRGMIKRKEVDNTHQLVISMKLYKNKSRNQPKGQKMENYL